MLYILQTGYAYVIINTVLKANSGTKSKGKSPVDGATGDFFILVFKSLLTGLLRLPFTIQPCGNDVKNHTSHDSKQS